MKIITKREVRRMSYRDRLLNYEMEKQEILAGLKSDYEKTCTEALEYLREKWMV